MNENFDVYLLWIFKECLQLYGTYIRGINDILETVQDWLCIQLNLIGLFDKIVNEENFIFKKAIREISFLHLQEKAA